MTRKSKAKQERYCVLRHEAGVPIGICVPLRRAKKNFKTLSEAGWKNLAIFKLVRVRSKPKSGGGGRK